MSNDTDNVSKVLATAKGLLPTKEFYDDAGRPLAREAGKAAGAIGHFANSALRPVKSLEYAWNKMLDRLDGWLVERLGDIPSSELVDPPANLAGNALAGLSFAQDEPDLREMFVSLLATAMTRSKSRLAHPAYVGILKEMTADEARIARYFSEHDRIPLFRIRARLADGAPRRRLRDAAICRDLSTLWREPRLLLENSRPEFLWTESGDPFETEQYDPRPWVDEALVAHFPTKLGLKIPEDIPLYLDNMVRNRLAHVYLDNSILDDAAYRRIVNCATLTKIATDFHTQGFQVSLLPCLISVTNFGKSFHEACVPKSRK